MESVQEVFSKWAYWKSRPREGPQIGGQPATWASPPGTEVQGSSQVHNQRGFMATVICPTSDYTLIPARVQTTKRQQRSHRPGPCAKWQGPLADFLEGVRSWGAQHKERAGLASRPARRQTAHQLGKLQLDACFVSLLTTVWSQHTKQHLNHKKSVQTK